MALTAVIFDVDGTLIDTNQAHVEAWSSAFHRHEYEVSPDRIGVEIGKGGDKLIPAILGQGIEQREGESLRKAHTEEFKKIAESSRLAVFAGVEPLLKELRRRGLKLAIATSSSPEELRTTERSAGVEWSNLFDVVATSADASQSKPHPAILQAAVAKLGISAAECVMVGDTPFDAETARDAGAVCFGVTCGKMNDAKTLRAAGMRQVYTDPAELLEQLDAAIVLASPGPVVLTVALQEKLMYEALTTARLGMERNEVPIGCVIARGDGTIVARGHNEQNLLHSKTAHAEMVAFGRTNGKVPPEATDLILVSTLEPCVMCLGASMEAAVDTILYGLAAPADGGTQRVRPPVSPESRMPRIVGNVSADQSKQLLEQFLNRPGTSAKQAEYVQQLLASV
jgi:HAD superfamily hydrolase (TIGR01509 family)